MLGWLLSLSLAMNGCSFPFLAPTIYKLLTVQDEDTCWSIPTNELPLERKSIVKKVCMYEVELKAYRL